jgi:magnesium transporter
VPAVLESLTVIPGVRWYHLSNPLSPALDELAAHFGIHPLQVEDCRHRRQTARLEEHEGYAFVVIKPLSRAAPENHAARNSHPGSAEGESVENLDAEIRAEGVSPSGKRMQFEDFDIILGSDYILTVDEGGSQLLPLVMKRLAAERSLQNPDCIAHALIDAAVDQYLPALDQIGDFINRVEDRVLRNPTPATLGLIFRLKRELLDLRRVATAMREAVNGLVRRYDAAGTSRPQKLNRELRIYYRDVYDHIVRVIDFVETYRDLLTGSLDIYLSAVANRTNDVMKILTLWGTVALPLLILTSFYGMNVKLPLQEHPHVMAMLGALMLASSLAVLLYFKRKRWF